IQFLYIHSSIHHIICLINVIVILNSIFFFSSRRRHTRSTRDWSSDVCSSDLMIGLYRATAPGVFDDVSIPSGIGAASRNTLGFGCIFLDIDLDGALDLAVANGHIDETVRNIRGNVGYAQPPQVFLNSGGGIFRDVAGQVGGGFESPKVGRGLAYADFDRDGDLDILMTTN